jgi:DNA-binding transcriptional MocR family regulator
MKLWLKQSDQKLAMAIQCQVELLRQEELLLKSKFSLLYQLNIRFSHPDYPFTENDVVLGFGCSGALYNSISALCEEGDNILVAKPGFPLAYPIA